MLCNAGSPFALPQLTLSLGSDNPTNGRVTYTSVCPTTLDLSQLNSADSTPTTDNSNFTRVSAALFQNSFQKCIPFQEQITSFAFQLTLPTTVSFGFDNVTHAASTLQLNGKVSIWVQLLILTDVRSNHCSSPLVKQVWLRGYGHSFNCVACVHCGTKGTSLWSKQLHKLQMLDHATAYVIKFLIPLSD